MKKLLLIMLAFTTSYAVNAQIQTPAPSPASKIEQKVGLTDVTIEYSRPSMKGRVIFGDLVPFGKIWRTGANARTKISFSDDVTIAGTTVKAGSYAIFTIPNADTWDVIFYTEHQGAGAPQTLDESKIAARTTVDVHAIPFDVQTFSFDINNLSNSSATIDMIWEKTYVAIPFTVPTDAKVSAGIESVMSGPGFNDYYGAASYYYSEGKNLDTAKKWIDKAMSMTDSPQFWQLRQQSLIYAATGDKKGAIALAKQSLAAAEKAGNADYVKMNKESLAEWQK
ncbi:DUF2911 domain-containing protein [Pontimicrobium aquaticum]|uniref:DUF2911 domain-containing protein n=1 Tax=Pontimicrobium aquaticum TaxID=2565367 RepID=A0A4U0EZM0_9FLAO|nr:DUF2911 domain-containing protein [Pontimicrobium aquaticum]TJY35832.1 DUF2911 domain-containing protein [Pontimicrobium aquaticum]